MHSLEILQWDSTRRDHLGYPGRVSGSGLVTEPFSLNSSHSLTPIILGCFSAYGMHVCQFQYSLITCKYINMNILA